MPLFNLSLQASLAGNTAGALAVISSGTMILAGGNNVTLSQNANSVTISAFTQTVQTQNLLDLSLAGNTSGALALVSSGTAILAGGNNITLSQNGQSITISAGNAGGAAGTVSQWWPMPEGIGGALGQNTTGIGTILVHPFKVAGNFSASRLNFFLSASLSTSTNSSHGGTLTMAACIYTRNASTLNTASSGTRSFAWTNTSNNSSGQLSGVKMFSIPLNVNLTAGDYWLGYSFSSATANANWISISTVFQSYMQTFSGMFGSALNGTDQYIPGWGTLTVSTNAFANIGFSDLSGSSRAFVPVCNFVNFTA